MPSPLICALCWPRSGDDRHFRTGQCAWASTNLLAQVVAVFFKFVRLFRPRQLILPAPEVQKLLRKVVIPDSDFAQKSLVIGLDGLEPGHCGEHVGAAELPI